MVSKDVFSGVFLFKALLQEVLLDMKLKVVLMLSWVEVGLDLSGIGGLNKAILGKQLDGPVSGPLGVGCKKLEDVKGKSKEIWDGLG